MIDKENGGHGSAVNAGIDAAHGKYLRIVDADDWLDSASLPALLDALEAATADLVVDQKFENNLETGAETHFPLPPELPFNKTLNFADYRGDGMTEYYMLHTLSVRLPLLRALNVRLLEHTFYVDFEYILKVTSRAQTIEFLPLFVYHYLVGNAAQSVETTTTSAMGIIMVSETMHSIVVKSAFQPRPMTLNLLSCFDMMLPPFLRTSRCRDRSC